MLKKFEKREQALGFYVSTSTKLIVAALIMVQIMIFSAQPAQAQEVPTSPNGQNSPGSTVEQKSNQFRIIRKIKNPPIAQTRRAKITKKYMT